MWRVFVSGVEEQCLVFDEVWKSSDGSTEVCASDECLSDLMLCLLAFGGTHRACVSRDAVRVSRDVCAACEESPGELKTSG